MKSTILLLLLAALALSTTAAFAADRAIVAQGQSVAVLPLTHYYQVDQEFARSTIEAKNYLKGNFNEKMSGNSRKNVRVRDSNDDMGGSYSDHASSSKKHDAKGVYDLESGGTVSVEKRTDRIITEKHLDTQKFTGILEAALSEAGIRIADRQAINKIFSERGKMEDPDFAPTALQRATKMHVADFVLTGQVISVRVEKPRTVPDGSNSRYAVGSSIKISVKLVNAQNGTSDFAKLITGRSRVTFDAADPAPIDQAADEAIEDLAAQLTTALTGQRARVDEDSEYQDSPGKKLIR